MIRGLYSSAAGMMAQETRNETIANNLANVNTNGYRRQITSFVDFARVLNTETGTVLGQVPHLAPSLLTSWVASDAQPGAIHTTGNHTDLAIDGDGYFTVQLPNGTEAYTRDGAFTLDNQQRLTTSNGYPVLGENGPITLNSPNWEINPAGQVVEDGRVVNRLKLMSLPNLTASTRLGKNLWQGSAVPTTTQPRINQSSLEGSNVNAVTEMVDLITATRTFEANQKCLQAQDSTLQHAVNDIGRV